MLELFILASGVILGLPLGRHLARTSPAAAAQQLAPADLPARIASEIERAQALERSVAVLVFAGDSAEVLARLALGLPATHLISQRGGLAWLVAPDIKDEVHAREMASSWAEACGAACGYALGPVQHDAAADLMQAAVDACRHAAPAQAQTYDPQLLAPVPAQRPLAALDDDLATVVLLAEALDLRDADTARHSLMVSWYAQLMATQLGLGPARAERVRIAGLLHDLGKIGIPDAVLHKPAKLTDDEYALMQAHPKIGARVLAPVNAPDIAQWVLCHHERVDGKGYPGKIEGAFIPIEARILAVADTYEAMTADRVYREAPGHAKAVAELQRCSGTQFDAEVVETFIKVLERIGHGAPAKVQAA